MKHLSPKDYEEIVHPKFKPKVGNIIIKCRGCDKEFEVRENSLRKYHDRACAMNRFTKNLIGDIINGS